MKQMEVQCSLPSFSQWVRPVSGSTDAGKQHLSEAGERSCDASSCQQHRLRDDMRGCVKRHTRKRTLEQQELWSSRIRTAVEQSFALFQVSG